MTAHVVVPALDSEPATISAIAVTGLLRGELGFDGVVVSDALEMRAVAARVGAEEARCGRSPPASMRSASATTSTTARGRTHAAIVDAVRSGRLSEERLSAARLPSSVSAVSRLPPLRMARLTVRSARRLHGARFASGATSRSTGRRSSSSSSRRRWSRPARLRTASARDQRAPARFHSRPVHDQSRDSAQLARSAEGRPLVIALRDAARHPWQQAIASELVELRPDAVLVETGLPGWLPRGSMAHVETFGAGRVNLEAAAEALVR